MFNDVLKSTIDGKRVKRVMVSGEEVWNTHTYFSRPGQSQKHIAKLGDHIGWARDIGPNALHAGPGSYNPLPQVIDLNGERALHFDGPNQNVGLEVPDHPSLDINNAITIEAWAYPEYTDDMYRMILTRGDRYQGFSIRHGRTDANNFDMVFELFLDGGTERLIAAYDANETEVNGVVEPPSGPGFPIFTNPMDFHNQWNHYALTFDGSKLTGYLNGQVVGVGYRNGTVDMGSEPIYIGANDTADNAEAWLGCLKDIRVWDVARSKSQINTAMNTELKGNESGLVACWPLMR